MARVYVSSTFSDLEACRKAVRRVLRRLGHVDMAMEYYTAGDQRPLDRCERDAAECDLYVGIFAWRYGYMPPGREQSITELEFRAAGEAGKERLCFLLHEDAPWPRSLMDRDADRIEALRAEIQRDFLIDFFTDAKDLAAMVGTAVARAFEDGGECLDSEGYARKMFERYGRVDLEALTPPEKEEALRVGLPEVFVEQGAREDRPPVELPKEVWEKLREEGQVDGEELEKKGPYPRFEPPPSIAFHDWVAAPMTWAARLVEVARTSALRLLWPAHRRLHVRIRGREGSCLPKYRRTVRSHRAPGRLERRRGSRCSCQVRERPADQG